MATAEEGFFLTVEQIREAARDLDFARLERVEMEQLSIRYPGFNLNDAYAVQDEGIRLRLAQDENIIGLKMGLTSEAKMKQMGVASPIYGVLTDVMQIPNSGFFSPQKSRAIHPRIEPEIAFFVAADLRGKVSAEEALAACSGVYAALEIVDSRYNNFKFNLPDVIADNCSSCAFVLGPWTRITDIEALGRCPITLFVDGAPVETGSSQDIFGNPARSLAELCAMLDSRGLYLKKGSFVLAGAATRAVSLETCRRVEVFVQGLGRASVSISD